MANGKSAFATANDNTPLARATAANYYDYNWVRGVRRDVITLLGTEADAAYHDLGPIVRDGTILVPEECRVRHGGAGTTTTINLVSARLDRVIYKAAPVVGVAWTRSTTTATVTTTAKHGFVKGQLITCSLSSSVAAITGTAAVPVVKEVKTVASDYVYTIDCLDAGDASGTATLGPAAGQIQPLTAAHAGITAITASHVFSAVDGLFLPVLLVNDRLRFTITDMTTITAARTLHLELALDVPRA